MMGNFIRKNTKVKYFTLLLLISIETGLLGLFLYAIHIKVLQEFADLSMLIFLSVWIFPILPIVMYYYMKSTILEVFEIEYFGVKNRLICFLIIVAEILGTVIMYPLAYGVFYRNSILVKGSVYALQIILLPEFVMLIFNGVVLLKEWRMADAK